MRCKVVCPVCGDVAKTYSINNFRHCGSQYDVKTNLLAGEAEKYQKMVAKEGKPVVKIPKPVEKPIEKIVEKVEAKQAEKPVTEPIIVEKVPQAPIVEKEQPVKKKRKKKSEIEEKVVKEEVTEETSFGFFD